MDWISVDEKLPPFRQNVLCYQPPAYANYSKKPLYDRVLIGYLFEIAPGERDGKIDEEIVGDRQKSLSEGGVFWAFPYICSQKFVTHWMPLPEHPNTKKTVQSEDREEK